MHSSLLGPLVFNICARHGLKPGTTLTALTVARAAVPEPGDAHEDHHHPLAVLACACVLLAAKVEEDWVCLPRVVACCKSLLRRPRGASAGDGDSDAESIPFAASEADLSLVRQTEIHVLAELGFCVPRCTDPPHRLLGPMLELLVGIEDQRRVAQNAWGYLNDYVILQVSSSGARPAPSAVDVACAALALAADDFQVALPVRPDPWWVVLGAQRESIEEVAASIVTFQSSQLRMEEASSPFSAGGSMEASAS